MENETNFNAAELKFIDLLSDGGTFDGAFEQLKVEPWNLTFEQVETFYKNPDILQAIIEQASNKLGQAWGTMWKNIKNKAMLGSIQHSKLLIDFVQNKGGINLGNIKITFDD